MKALDMKEYYKMIMNSCFKEFELSYHAKGCKNNPYLTQIKFKVMDCIITAPTAIESSLKKLVESHIVQSYKIEYTKINEKKSFLSIGYIIEGCNMEMRHYLVKTKVRKEDACDREQD